MNNVIAHEHKKFLKKSKHRRDMKKQLKAYLFVGPHLFFFCVFFVAPFFYGIFISFTTWNLMSSPSWAGLYNFKAILTPGTLFFEQFFNGLKNTAFYTIIMVPLMIVVPLLFALALKSIGKANKGFQALLYAPSLLSVATVVLTWRWLLDRELGAINNIFGIDTNWAGSQPYAWVSIFMLTLWSGIGGNMIIFLAGLSNVPKTYYEAAEIDGAGSLTKFFKITLPELRFQLLFTTIMGTIGAFNVFGQPFMFGGPEESTRVLMIYIQDYAFGGSTPIAGMASAMALLLGIIISFFSAIQSKLMGTKKDV